jgi:hypothetical protein
MIDPRELERQKHENCCSWPIWDQTVPIQITTIAQPALENGGIIVLWSLSKSLSFMLRRGGIYERPLPEGLGKCQSGVFEDVHTESFVSRILTISYYDIDDRRESK